MFQVQETHRVEKKCRFQSGGGECPARAAARNARTVITRAVMPLLAILCADVAAPAFQLPPDEAGLTALLEEMAIDTSQYEQLLAIYALPLSVPMGELAQLGQIFPDIAGMIPTPEELESYRPFDNRQIQRLFNDFPVIAEFEPALRFNTSQPSPGMSGEIIFGVNRSRVDELRGHRARFRQRGRHVSTEGSVRLDDTGALWQTRRVDLSLPGRASAQIGNFKQPIPGELFWGRFSALTAGERGDVSANWLYGGTNTWNGAVVELKKIPGAEALGFCGFGHIRPGERGAGGAADWRVNRRIRVVLGLTGMEFINDTDSVDNVNNVDNVNDDVLYTAHLYGEYKGKIWRAAMEAGLPLGRENIIPALSLRISYRIKESSAQYHLISYPDDFTAPMSRVKRQLLTEAGERQPPGLARDPQSPAVQKHSLSMTVPISVPMVDMMRIIPDIEFTESGGIVKRVHGRAEIRTRVNKGTNIALRHASRVFTMGVDSVLHTSGASVSVQTGYSLEIRASAQSVYGYYRNARNTYSLELQCAALPNTVIAPFVRGKYVSAHEYWLGLKSEIHLYKKTWTGITVEMPVNVKGAEGVYIKGSSSYTF